MQAVLQVLQDLHAREAAGPRHGMQIVSPLTGGGRCHLPKRQRAGLWGLLRAGAGNPQVQSEQVAAFHRGLMRTVTCTDLTRVARGSHTHTHTSLQPVPRPNFIKSPLPQKAPPSASLTCNSPPSRYKAPTVGPSLWHLCDAADKRQKTPPPSSSKDRSPWANRGVVAGAEGAGGHLAAAAPDRATGPLGRKRWPVSLGTLLPAGRLCAPAVVEARPPPNLPAAGLRPALLVLCPGVNAEGSRVMLAGCAGIWASSLLSSAPRRAQTA